MRLLIVLRWTGGSRVRLVFVGARKLSADEERELLRTMMVDWGMQDLPTNVCDYNVWDNDKIVCSGSVPTQIRLESKLRALFHMRRTTGDKKNAVHFLNPKKRQIGWLKDGKRAESKAPGSGGRRRGEAHV